MRMKLFVAASVLAAGLAAGGSAVAGEGADRRLSPEAQAFTQVTRSTAWDLVDRIPLAFDTYHPQGMALVGDMIFLSSVEITEPTVRYPEPVDGYDRSTGAGTGHVFVLTRDGGLVEDIEVGQGSIYHPGGIDFDGQRVWVPVAEYRPNSASIVYSIDPDTYAVNEELRHDDHVGGVVIDRTTGQLNGVSWGSRTLFAWNQQGRLLRSTTNPDHMLDYQDCAYAGGGHQLCSGVTGLPTSDGGTFELGGLALTELSDGSVAHQVPISLFSTAGHAITRNPVSLEREGDVLRLFAAPDDGGEPAGTELFVYEARP